MTYDPFSRCHPAVNLLFFLGAIGFGVVIQHPGYILTGLIAAGIYNLLLDGQKGILRILSMIPVFAVLSAINPLFNTRGKTVLFHILGNPYTLEALLHGMAVSGILILMLLWFSCYSKIMTSDKFLFLFAPLAPSLSMLLVMVLRMIPGFFRRGRQISNGRTAIGKGTSGSLKETLPESMNRLSALTDWALEGSIATADSMNSRGYGAKRRSHFPNYTMTARDWTLLVLLPVLSAVVLLHGGMEAVYTPEIAFAGASWGLAAYAGFLLIPSILHIWEVILWHSFKSRI